MCVCVYVWPLTEEISLKIFGCRGLTIVSLDLLSDRDSVYTREPRMKIWGLPWKRVWYVRGLPWNLVGNFGSRQYFKSELLRLWRRHVALCVYVCMCDIPHSYAWHGSLTCESWLMYMCCRTYSLLFCLKRYGHKYTILLIRMRVMTHSPLCDMTHCCSASKNMDTRMRYYSFVCMTWLIHICVTWLIHMCDMTHSCVWHDSFMGSIWLIHMCDTTHSYVWHDSFVCVTWLSHR